MKKFKSVMKTFSLFIKVFSLFLVVAVSMTFLSGSMVRPINTSEAKTEYIQSPTDSMETFSASLKGSEKSIQINIDGENGNSYFEEDGSLPIRI